MTREDVIRKVQALLVLQHHESTEEALASSAALKVKEWMDKFKIKHSELFAVLDDEDITMSSEFSVTGRKWEQIVASSIAELFECRIVWDVFKLKRSLSFIGTPLDVDVCTQVWKKVYGQVLHSRRVFALSHGYVENSSCVYDFMLGLAVGIYSRVYTVVNARNEKLAPSQQALAIQKHNKIEKYAKGKFSHFTIDTVNSLVNKYCYDSGKRNSNNIQIHNAVSSDQ